MTKANECTCPSGDGSLRHPCPAHPASVELAGVAANLTFINGRPAMCGCQVEYSSGGGEYSDVIYVTLCAKHSGSAILDLVATNRIALTPEYEGQWHADLYLDREIPLAKAEGATPAEAVLALMSAERIDPEQESVEQAGGDERDAALARVAELEAKLSDPTAVHQWQFSNAWLDGSEEVVLKASKEGSPIRTLYTAPAQAQHSVPAYVSYTTRPAESLAGIALRQLKDESRWVEIRDINAHAFPDMQSHSYYPAGTVIKLPAAAPGKSVPQAWLDVLAERRRQVEAEGWTPEHDDLYCAAELPRAAAAYILSGANDEAPAIWPFLAKWWKPRDARANYVRAGALILAEIERLDRAAAPGKGDAARQQCGGMEMEIQELRENAAKLATFAQEIISGALEGGSFDGADIQESAERHGLIAKQMMREPCRGPEEYCACAWSTSFPTECYRVTPKLRALLNQDKENGNG